MAPSSGGQGKAGASGQKPSSGGPGMGGAAPLAFKRISKLQ